MKSFEAKNKNSETCCIYYIPDFKGDPDCSGGCGNNNVIICDDKYNCAYRDETGQCDGTRGTINGSRTIPESCNNGKQFAADCDNGIVKRNKCFIPQSSYVKMESEVNIDALCRYCRNMPGQMGCFEGAMDSNLAKTCENYFPAIDLDKYHSGSYVGNK